MQPGVKQAARSQVEFSDTAYAHDQIGNHPSLSYPLHRHTQQAVLLLTKPLHGATLRASASSYSAIGLTVLTKNITHCRKQCRDQDRFPLGNPSLDGNPSGSGRLFGVSNHPVFTAVRVVDEESNDVAFPSLRCNCGKNTGCGHYHHAGEHISHQAYSFLDYPFHDPPRKRMTQPSNGVNGATGVSNEYDIRFTMVWTFPRMGLAETYCRALFYTSYCSISTTRESWLSL